MIQKLLWDGYSIGIEMLASIEHWITSVMLSQAFLAVLLESMYQIRLRGPFSMWIGYNTSSTIWRQLPRDKHTL